MKIDQESAFRWFVSLTYQFFLLLCAKVIYYALVDGGNGPGYILVWAIYISWMVGCMMVAPNLSVGSSNKEQIPRYLGECYIQMEKS